MAKKAEEVTEEVMAEEAKAPVVDRRKFVMRKLRAINEMPNKAKARLLADRLLNKK